MIEEIFKTIQTQHSYNDVLVAGATFTGTVLAIFFTLIALPIENVLSRYSQDMIKRVQRDLIFWSSFLFLTATFAFDVILITFGSNPKLVLVSLGLTVDSVLVLGLLVIHTFYMLDVRNQLNDITHDIKKQIKGRMHKSEGKRKKSFEKFKKFLKMP